MGNVQNNLIVPSEWIKRNLKDYKPERAVSEYIENSIDAWAKNIQINYEGNLLDSIDSFEIIDDWCWFAEKDLPNTFSLLLYSNKVKSLYHSNVFWKDWIWRLTFFSFATDAIRESLTKNETIKISISSADLSKYEILDKKEQCNKQTWTKINFLNVKETKSFWDQKLPEELIQRFSWIHYLKNIKIFINWEELDFSKHVEKQEEKEIEVKKYLFNIKLIKRRKSLAEEESKNYFVKSDWEELLKIWTSLNRQSDSFFHSVIIKSSFFDNIWLNEKWENFDFWNDEIWKENRIIYSEFIKRLDKILVDFRKPFIEDFAKNYIDENVRITWRESILENHKKRILRATIKEIYLQEPKILTQLSDEQKQIFINLIWLILEEWNDNKLFDIIWNVLKLPPEERLNFWNLISEISLSNIIKTIEIIKSRLETIELLNKLIFDKNLETKENPDLQDVISNNYWIFWEEYHLLAWTWELKFQKVLTKFLWFVNPSVDVEKIKHPSAKKELDLLLAQQERLTGKTKNIVIELKRPNVKLWLEEFTQVMEYFNLIYNEKQFNWENFEWKFYLVGNDIDSYIRSLYSSNRHHGEYVIHKNTDDWKNYTIYCYKWSDLLENNRQRLQYLKDQLEINLDNFNDEIDKIDNKEEIKTLLKNKQ